MNELYIIFSLLLAAAVVFLLFVWVIALIWG
jgi:hypothetical protein